MTDTTNAASNSRQKYLPYLLLAVAVFAAYSNVYGNNFLFDDNLIITLNSYLKDWSSFGALVTSSTTSGAHIAGGFYRPVQLVLYLIIDQITGETPAGFHFLNVALHMANACLMYRLGLKLKFSPGAVFIASLLWALHPIHTEAITYISATADVLFAFFTLLGIVILLPDFTPRKFLIVTPVFILGLFSKETMVVFPLLVMSCMYLLQPDRLKSKIYLRTLPFWIVTAIYMIWRMSSTSFDGPARYTQLFQLKDYYNLSLYSEHISYRIYTFLATLPAYLQLLIWPVGLHMERNFAVFANLDIPQVLLGLLMLLTALSQIIWSKGRRGLPLSWGLLWFGAAHFPDSGLLVAINALFLEHWMYLPTVGLFLGIAQTLSTCSDNEKFRKLQPHALKAFLLIALVFAVMTYRQNEVWHDPITFYTNVFKYGEISARAHNNLALAYADHNEPQKAVEEFHKAIAITDTYAETRHNLALTLLSMPDQRAQIPEAIKNLERAIEIDPNFYRSYEVLAKIYSYIGDKEKAASYQQKFDELKPPQAP